MKFKFEYFVSISAAECQEVLIQNSFKSKHKEKFEMFFGHRSHHEFPEPFFVKDYTKIILWSEERQGQLTCYYYFELFEKVKKDIVATANISEKNKKTKISIAVNVNPGSIIVPSLLILPIYGVLFTDLPILPKLGCVLVSTVIFLIFILRVRSISKRLSLLLLKKIQNHLV